jgi:GR25 family glycosyltransferase involved in LPS biosynthesis
MKIQEFVDGGFYINLDHRKDKNEFMISQLKNLGLFDFVKRFSAIAAFDSIDFRVNDSEKMFLLGRATSLSHKSIIQIAKEKNYKNVLIMEDDALFHITNNYSGLDTIEKALDELKIIDDWEIFFLGANLHDKELNLVSNHLIKCDCCVSTHAYIVNEKCYDKILSNQFDKPFDVMDIFLNNNFKQKYICYPASVIQKSGNLTDIGGHYSMSEEFWLSQYNKPIIKHFI